MVKPTKTAKRLLIITLYCISIVACKEGEKHDPPISTEKIAAKSFSGSPLFSPAASLELMMKVDEKRKRLEADSSDVMNWIWYGRFLAYSGDYEAAIKLYTEGIKKFPDDERLYRHRGHRYITIRKIDDAIADFSQASNLIEGKENASEPDGMPNAMNIPVSTTHGNIWYHLGLSYYLKADFENALSAFQNCYASGANPDNIVSSSHWIYMILRRLDRGGEAEKIITPIDEELEVIENHAYHKLCLFYKGLISEEDLLKSDDDSSANDAILYGLGNWYYYNDDKQKASEIWNEILQRPSWNSFGYIAAESEQHNQTGKIQI